MITGIGRNRISFSRKSRPFMFGISTSSVTTSGSSDLIAWRASRGSAGFSDDFDVGVALQHRRDQHSHRAGIIDNENSDRLHDKRAFTQFVGGDAVSFESRCRITADTFGMADVESPTGRKDRHEAVPHQFLCAVVEINDDVAAEDHLKAAAHRPIAEEVELTNADELSQRAGRAPDLRVAPAQRREPTIAQIDCRPS